MNDQPSNKTPAQLAAEAMEKAAKKKVTSAKSHLEEMRRGLTGGK